MIDVHFRLLSPTLHDSFYESLKRPFFLSAGKGPEGFVASLGVRIFPHSQYADQVLQTFIQHVGVRLEVKEDVSG